MWCLNTLAVLFGQDSQACWRRATDPIIVLLSSLHLISRWSCQIIHICIVEAFPTPMFIPLQKPTLASVSVSLKKQKQKRRKKKACIQRKGLRGWTPGVKGQIHFESKILFLLQPVSLCVWHLQLCVRFRVSFSHDFKLPACWATTTMCPREPKLQCEKPGWPEAFLTPPSHTNVCPFSWQFHWDCFMFFFHVCHPPAYSLLTWLLNNIELGLSRQQDTWLTTGGISADNMGLNSIFCMFPYCCLEAFKAICLMWFWWINYLS